MSAPGQYIYGAFQGELELEVEPEDDFASFWFLPVSLAVGALLSSSVKRNITYINHKKRWQDENEVMQMLLWYLQMLCVFTAVVVLLLLLFFQIALVQKMNNS